MEDGQRAGKHGPLRIGTRRSNATRLVFTHSDMAFPWVGLVLPGWHTHFERLAKALGTKEKQPLSMDRWRVLQAEYVTRYALTGVTLDPPCGHGDC